MQEEDINASGGLPTTRFISRQEVVTVNVRRPRGTNDILPEDARKWQLVEAKIRDICHRFGYQEIRTPIFEHTELFERGIGEATDIVEKEMYTFTDRGDRSITLRPEGTACVVRAFIENKLYAQSLPSKLYYVGPMFRYEKPQAGRYRQFSQFGVEAIGSMDPFLDVEMIILPIELYKACGLSDFQVHINSLGCPECRPKYREVLQQHLGEKFDQFCENCQSRISRNPLRVLDCKNPKCQALVAEIPLITNYLCTECSDHFQTVIKYLDLLEIDYELNPKLVRGFDYYTKTVFEITVSSLGAQNAIGGGGRYDGLVEEIGGKPMPAVGYAVGVDRLLLALEQQQIDIFPEQHADVYVAHFGGDTKTAAVDLVVKLRASGLWVETDYMDRSLKAQMKSADKFKSRWVVIVGEEELKTGTVKVRRMDTGTEADVALDQIVEYLSVEKEG